MLKENGKEKVKKKHGKLFRCTCGKRVDLDEERELGNIYKEFNIEILNCPYCGNDVQIK